MFDSLTEFWNLPRFFHLEHVFFLFGGGEWEIENCLGLTMGLKANEVVRVVYISVVVLSCKSSSE